jgi:hypothetical protein
MLVLVLPAAFRVADTNSRADCGARIKFADRCRRDDDPSIAILDKPGIKKEERGT